ncbi:MAG: hypothetical protein KJ578_15900 [Bacteroidetes bacterium]|nr:hypothetical protein [Bacteroidota bacterium]
MVSFNEIENVARKIGMQINAKEVEKESEFELSFISTVLREGKKLYG